MEKSIFVSIKEIVYKKYGGDVRFFAQKHKTSVYKVHDWIRRDAHVINGKVCIPTKHSE